MKFRCEACGQKLDTAQVSRQRGARTCRKGDHVGPFTPLGQETRQTVLNPPVRRSVA